MLDTRSPQVRLTSSDQKDIKWVEGLRGIAAVLVATSHICLSFFGNVAYNPTESENTRGSILHFPILRLPSTGAPWLAMFFLLTGYVNAYKPIKQARNNEVSAAFAGLASSTFRRPWRLFLPTTIMTLISWGMMRLGLYSSARRCASGWITDTTPPYIPDIWASVIDLFQNLFSTWHTGVNNYDKNQWCIKMFLAGSIMLYITLLGTVKCAPKYRMIVMFGMYSYSYYSGDAVIGTNIFAGALLAELSVLIPSTSSISLTNTPSTTKDQHCTSIPRTILAVLLLGFGLFAGSFPEAHWEWASWSRALANLGFVIFPAEVELYRYWPSMGAQAITLSIIIMPKFQAWLSHPFLMWLGQISFPLYLIHGPLLRSVLIWMVFGVRKFVWMPSQGTSGEQAREVTVLPMPKAWVFVLAIPLFFVMLGAASQCWIVYVEPWCARFSRWVEDVMCPRLGEGVGKVESLEKGLPSPNGKGGSPLLD